MSFKQKAYTGIILSGGLNSRMGGNSKGLLPLGDKNFLESIVETLRPLVSELIVVTREPQLYNHLDCSIVEDIFSVRSSLTGIHAGLYHSSNKYSFLVACDTPLLNRDLVQLLLQESESGQDIVVPKNGHNYEPLCAVYSKVCIPHIESLLQQNLLKISKLFDLVTIKEINEERLQELDPNLDSFFNVNTPQDMLRLTN